MRCEHHPTCPGCPLLDASPEAQLEIKRGRLLTALGRYPHLKLGARRVPPVLSAVRGEGYRHRLKLPLHVTKSQVTMGLYDRGTGKVLNTPDCPVLADGLRAAIPPLLEWLKGRATAHSVDLRMSAETGELQLVLAARAGRFPGGDGEARVLMGKVPGLMSIAVSRADPERKRVMGRRPEIVAGRARLTERIGDTSLRIHPGAFFQVDPLNAEQLHGLVREAVGEAASVLDLYAGVAAYARMLAPGRERVVAVEEVSSAVKAARDGAPSNLEVIRARVEDLDWARLGRFDAVVINPARRGSDPQTLSRIARLTDRLVYISCGPESLARDLDILAAHGLRVAGISPLDLFPQTAEIETVVRLERGPGLRDWPIKDGRARSPWGAEPSGAKGRPERALALVIGVTPEHGHARGARFRRIGFVAGHSLLRLDLEGALVPALADLARNGHPVAGRHETTDRFFSSVAGLARPFVHIERAAGSAPAPLHGDLVWAMEALEAPPRLIARAGGPRAD